MHSLMDPLDEQRKKMKLEPSLVQWPSQFTNQQQQQQMILRVQQLQALGVGGQSGGGQSTTPSPLLRPNTFPLDPQTSGAFMQSAPPPLPSLPLALVQGGPPSVQGGAAFYQSGPFTEGMTGSFSFQSVGPAMGMGAASMPSGPSSLRSVGAFQGTPSLSRS